MTKADKDAGSVLFICILMMFVFFVPIGMITTTDYLLSMSSSTINPGDRVIIKTETLSFTLDDTHTECLVKEVSKIGVKVEYFDTMALVQRSVWVYRSQITDVLPASSRPLAAESSL